MHLSLPPRALLAALWLGLALPSQTAWPASRFVQDRFAIGYWVGPLAANNLEERYRELAGANFNLVIGTPRLTAAEQLRICERLDLRAIVEGRGPVEQWPESPACWGYTLRDEPGAADFPKLAGQAEEVRTRHPGRFGYINLFPNYASPAQLGTRTYEEHVARFMAEVKPEVLSMDHYPLLRPDADGRAAYCENLETMRRHSVAAGVPFWNFFYSMPFNDRLDPTEAQIRWQIFAAIAHGAKGVLYFCYWTPGQGAGGAGEFPKGGAIITAEGRRTRHYDEARRINAELKHLGPTLMALQPLGVTLWSTTNTPANMAGEGALRRLVRVGGDPHSQFLVGEFRHADGRRAVLVLNDSYAHTAWPTVEFAVPAAQVLEVGKETGKLEPVVDDSPELKGLQLSFGAGDGRLFVLPAGR